jgi:uncharacterized membrane protein
MLDGATKGTSDDRRSRTLNFRLSRPGERFLIYGLAGWAIDSLFVCIGTGRWRPSSPLNVPVYGLAQPLFEPVHDRMRRRPLPQRAAMYGAGILAVEYASGWLLRRLVGSAPWDYGRARFAISGFVRLDYLPLWAAYGLGLERLHDLLMGPPRAEAGSSRPCPPELLPPQPAIP